MVRGSSPHYLVRGRGGSRCRAQVLRIKQQRPYAPLSKNGDFRIEPLDLHETLHVYLSCRCMTDVLLVKHDPITWREVMSK